MMVKIPTKKQAEQYVKLRKKGYSIKVSGDLIKKPSLAKKVIGLKKKRY